MIAVFGGIPFAIWLAEEDERTGLHPLITILTFPYLFIRYKLFRRRPK